MPNLTAVTVTAGVPTAGTGTVSTLDGVIDATNGPVAVKAASTAAVAADKAMVVAISPNNVNANGQATMANSAPVVPASNWVYNTGYYVTAAASATTTLQSSTGQTGDYLDHVVVFPGTTAAGSVAVIDNATTLVTWPGGGTTALLTLTPFTIYVGAVSRSGAWKLTLTGNVTALAVGRFS